MNTKVTTATIPTEGSSNSGRQDRSSGTNAPVSSIAPNATRPSQQCDRLGRRAGTKTHVFGRLAYSGRIARRAGPILFLSSSEKSSKLMPFTDLSIRHRVLAKIRILIQSGRAHV